MKLRDRVEDGWREQQKDFAPEENVRGSSMHNSKAAPCTELASVKTTLPDLVARHESSVLTVRLEVSPFSPAFHDPSA